MKNPTAVIRKLEAATLFMADQNDRLGRRAWSVADSRRVRDRVQARRLARVRRYLMAVAR